MGDCEKCKALGQEGAVCKECADALVNILQSEVEWLTAAIVDYLSEYETPVPDLGLRAHYRERLKALTGGRE